MEGRARPGSRPCIDRHRRPRPSSAACGPEAPARWRCWWAVVVPGSPRRRPGRRRPRAGGGAVAGQRPSAAEGPACAPWPGSGDGRRRPRPVATGRRPGGRPRGRRHRHPAAWVAPAGGGATIPALTLRAYREAAAWAAGFDPDCRLPGRSWPASAASSPTTACSGAGDQVQRRRDGEPEDHRAAAGRQRGGPHPRQRRRPLGRGRDLGPGGRADAVHPHDLAVAGPRRQRRPGRRPQQPVRRRGERRRLPVPERRRRPGRPGPAAPGDLQLQPLLAVRGRGARLGPPLPGRGHHRPGRALRPAGPVHHRRPPATDPPTTTTRDDHDPAADRPPGRPPPTRRPTTTDHHGPSTTAPADHRRAHDHHRAVPVDHHQHHHGRLDHHHVDHDHGARRSTTTTTTLPPCRPA